MNRDFLSGSTAGSLRLDLQWNHCLCNHNLSRKLISQAPLPPHERAVADPMLPAPLPLWHTASVARFYTPAYAQLYKCRKETIERVFADAKEKHAMRYT
ncbi:hypothetical protein, partial [Dysosmobacter sp.]|uniref:hypothetical protein n=1 Tax=Dysosmobacter sp. TaxID=2591382 RepID=UPI00267372A7